MRSEELELWESGSDTGQPQDGPSEEADYSSEDRRLGVERIHATDLEQKGLGSEPEEPEGLATEAEDHGIFVSEDAPFQGFNSEGIKHLDDAVNECRQPGFSTSERDFLSPSADPTAFGSLDSDVLFPVSGGSQELDRDVSRGQSEQQVFASDGERLEEGNLDYKEARGTYQKIIEERGRAQQYPQSYDIEKAGVALAEENSKDILPLRRQAFGDDPLDAQVTVPTLHASLKDVDRASDSENDDVEDVLHRLQPKSPPYRDLLGSSLGNELLRSYEGDENPEVLVSRAYQVGWNALL